MGSEKESNKTLRICGSGSVRKNKGRWQAVVSLIDEETGGRTQRTRNTGIACLSDSTRGRKSALDALAEFRDEIAAELAEAEGLRVAAEERQAQLEADEYALLPLGVALEKFIDFCLQMNRITPTTRDDYHFSALHIERDELGAIPVNEVTTDDINAWSARRIALGCAPDTLNKAFKLGKRLYTVLVKRSNDTIGKNPFDGALAPRIIGRPRNALRSDLVPKLNSICSMMPDSRFKRAVVLALHTGMRIGEVCGLRWCDVDFEAGLISVRHSVAYAKGMGSFIKDTKTHDCRAIPIDPVGLLPFLKEIHGIDLDKLRSRGLAGSTEIGDCYILSEPGASFATTSYVRRAFKTFSETNGLMGTNDELITFHGLRHTFATQWIRQGGDIKALQSILGHKDAMVTLNVYADIEPISKIHNMLRVSPCLWRGYLGLRVDPGPMFQQRIQEAVETLQAFGYGITEPDDRNIVIRDVKTISRLYPTEYAAVLGAIPAEATVI